MKTKSITLDSKKEVKIKEMSVDDIDYCNDLIITQTDSNGETYLMGFSRARTAWIRRGCVGADDKFIKGLSDPEKNNLFSKIQDYNTMGED